MSTGLIVAIVFVAGFVALIIFNYRRMKNIPEVKKSENIVILGTKNFKAQTKSGLTLVDFWAPWCGPCKMMTPILNDVADEVVTAVKVGKVNVDQHQAVAQKNKVRNIPTLVLYKDGVEIDRFVGVKSKKFLVKELKKQL